MATIQQRFCDNCSRSELSFDPDIEIQCTLGRQVRFVMPSRDEDLQIRQWGWVFINRNNKPGHCPNYTEEQFNAGVRPAIAMSGEGHASTNMPESERHDGVISRISQARLGATSNPSICSVRYSLKQCGVTRKAGILLPGPSRGGGPLFKPVERLPLGKKSTDPKHDGRPLLTLQTDLHTLQN